MSVKTSGLSDYHLEDILMDSREPVYDFDPSDIRDIDASWAEIQQMFGDMDEEMREKWGPIDDLIIQDAKDGIDVQGRMGLAQADVTAGYQGALEQQRMADSRMGVRPDSGAAQARQDQMAVQRAGDIAGTRTQARHLAEQEQRDMRHQVAQHGLQRHNLGVQQALGLGDLGRQHTQMGITRDQAVQNLALQGIGQDRQHALGLSAALGQWADHDFKTGKHYDLQRDQLDQQWDQSLLSAGVNLYGIDSSASQASDSARAQGRSDIWGAVGSVGGAVAGSDWFGDTIGGLF